MGKVVTLRRSEGSRWRTGGALRCGLALAVLAVGCDDSCDGPIPAPSVTELRVSVQGSGASLPAFVRRGQTAQLIATLALPNGQIQDVTSAVGWSSSSDEVMTVGPTGLVTAVKNGDACLRAFQAERNLSASLCGRVAVPPPSLAIDPPPAQVGLTAVIRWRVENAAETGETYHFRMHLDKGVNACDGQIEETVDIGNVTCLTLSFDPGRYDRQRAAFAIQADDLAGNSVCMGGGTLNIDAAVPATVDASCPARRTF